MDNKVIIYLPVDISAWLDSPRNESLDLHISYNNEDRANLINALEVAISNIQEGGAK